MHISSINTILTYFQGFLFFLHRYKSSQERLVKSTFSPDKAYLQWFATICNIPHESGNERRLSDFLVDFARERGLSVVQDNIGNIVIRKAGTVGMEKAPAVILQGHMDMVCVKNEDCDINFATDPLKLVADGDRLYADGTSLGADNGIALAYSLALLDSSDIPHPPLEVVVTVDEEVGMGGASAFDASLLSASLFINMDSEEEGVFCVSCAGGRRSQMHIPTETQKTTSLSDKEKLSFRRVTVSGLVGGHSGLEIIKERGNSNKLLARVLDALLKKFSCHIVSLHGGIAANAIPKESTAVIAICADDRDIAGELKHWEKIFRHELRGSDGAGLTLSLSEAEQSETVLTPDSSSRVLSAALLIPDGIASMDLTITSQRLVESSNNFAMIRMGDGEIVFHCQTRSSSSSRKEALCRQIEILGTLTGARVDHYGDYPAWEYNPDSRLQPLFEKAYRDLFQKNARVEGIHAGLECGLFAEKFRKLGHPMDFLSFGPEVTGAHSTRESLSLSSAERTWNLLLEVLRRIK